MQSRQICAHITGDSCDWLNLASKIGFNLDLAKHLYKHRAQANSVHRDVYFGIEFI